MHAALTREVDVFSGDNAGLMVAEIELDLAGQVPELPEWVGEGVTDDVPMMWAITMPASSGTRAGVV